MTYIKNYHLFIEGFTQEQLDNLISNGDTYIKKIKRFNSIENKKRLLADEIINYDISNFKYKYEYGLFIIKPDDNFDILYKKYCELNSLDYTPLTFDIEFTEKHPVAGYNTLDVYNLINSNIQGLSIAYKLYLFILDKVSFITSNVLVSDNALNLWYNLLKSNLVYSGISKNSSIIIKREIDDLELHRIINLVNKFEYKYDNELNKRINGFKTK